VTDYLFSNYPDQPEGILTSWRSALVKTESLAELAESLDIGQYLLMSRGELKSGGRERVALLANLVEAVIGAIYLDNGYDRAKLFITTHITTKLANIIKAGSYIDAKSHFQEIAQEKKGITPSYEVLEESGPDHDKHFEVGAYLGKKLYGKGTGSSKQAAQQSAAADALQKLQK
jgi:ribonuclease-3